MQENKVGGCTLACTVTHYKTTVTKMVPEQEGRTKERAWREFPGGLVVTIPGFCCHGLGSIPGRGTEMPQAVQPKKRERERAWQHPRVSGVDFRSQRPSHPPEKERLLHKWCSNNCTTTGSKGAPIPTSHHTQEPFKMGHGPKSKVKLPNF